MPKKGPFQWERQPQAETLALEIVDKAAAENPDLADLSHQLLHQTKTRLFDWLDHVVISEDLDTLQRMREAGYIQQGNGRYPVYSHPGAQLPRIVVQPSTKVRTGVAVSVDSIADFLMVRGEERPIEGSVFGAYRQSLFSLKNQSALWVVERRGTLSVQPSHEADAAVCACFRALEKWMSRPRPLFNEDEALQETLHLVQSLIEEVGQHRAAWTVLEGERRYWQSRNKAGQIQKDRQDRLGMGWANHDHHTFRSSRRLFSKLVHLFELLGFHCRERFYAGDEAGWGAQVMENPVCRLVLFLDVDLAPGEISGDFAHEPLPEIETLGTVGLWCALHGDSILKAGMHHLEAQFMFDELKEALSQDGVQMMAPFSSFDYLKQAFTVGEHWPVNSVRLEELAKKGKITPGQRKHFLEHGAVGSHLENLQRREGYKGFNQKNVSVIIKETDPRHYDERFPE
jgi:hypothetical protein